MPLLQIASAISDTFQGCCPRTQKVGHKGGKGGRRGKGQTSGGKSAARWNHTSKGKGKANGKGNGKGKGFQGNCWLCKQVGHSRTYCPNLMETDSVEYVEEREEVFEVVCGRYDGPRAPRYEQGFECRVPLPRGGLGRGQRALHPPPRPPGNNESLIRRPSSANTVKFLASQPGLQFCFVT